MVDEMTRCRAMRTRMLGGGEWIVARLDMERAREGIDRDGEHTAVWLTPVEAKALALDILKVVA